MSTADLLLSKARTFLEQAYSELGKGDVLQRLAEVEGEISASGTYTHTEEELEHGARMAWRNSNRCIGRLYWKSLLVRDRRKVRGADAVAAELKEHIRSATNKGKILPTITIFAAKPPSGPLPVRIWNKQLLRYAGYRQADGPIQGDPLNEPFTRECIRLGWKPGNGSFDLLPLLIQTDGAAPRLYELPKEEVLEVDLEHPLHPDFARLALRWFALPVVSDMTLEIGGIHYPAAPFNGWYMLTEIGSRNLGDVKRYDQLPKIAELLELRRHKPDPFWKDRALLILNEAVFHSFRAHGVILTDHHAAAEQFMKFIRNESNEGREVNADWSWIVPPNAGSAMEVFHQDFGNTVISPNFYYNNDAWTEDKQPKSRQCPFHASSLH